MINKVTLIGNLGADPEIKVLESGAKVARISLATNENYKDRSGEWQTKTEWHNVVAWRYNADKAEKMNKGDLVFVEGKVTYRKYTTQEGQEKYITDIVAREIRGLGSRREDDNRFPDSEPPTSGSASSSSDMGPFDKEISTPSTQNNQGNDDSSSDQNDDSDDLPF